MVDSTAQSARPSSREYLEQLRARRSGKVTAEPATPATASTSAPDPVPTPTPTSVPQPQATPPIAPSFAAAAAQATEAASQPPDVSGYETADNFTGQQPNQQPFDSELFPGQVRPQPEEVVYQWSAPSRPFKKRNRQFYTTIGLITLLLSLILFFAGQFLPIAVVIAVAFLGYVLSSVPPDTVTIAITTYGIRYDNVLYYWDELGRFWFEERYQQPMVLIEVARFPGRLTVMLGTSSKEDVENILSEVLLQQKPVETFVDKAAKWVQEKIPLDTH